MSGKGRSVFLLAAAAIIATAVIAVAEPRAGDKLSQLAKDRFTNDLTRAEEMLFRAAAIGIALHNTTGSPEGDDPANASAWEVDRSLRADRIAWLCTDAAASVLVSHRGIEIYGFRIKGDLDLRWAKIPFPIDAQNCLFTGQINLVKSRVVGLYLTKTHIKGLQAHGMEVNRDVFLRHGFKAEACVDLSFATIGGHLICEGGQFMASENEGAALLATGAKVGGIVTLRDEFRACGRVVFERATIGGAVLCDGGRFANSNGPAFSADMAETAAVSMRDVKVEGEVWFSGATIRGDFDCSGARFRSPSAGTCALAAEGAKIGADVLLKRVTANGKVTFQRAVVSGDVCFHQAELANSNNVALSVEHAKVEGSMLTDGFKAEGEIRLYGANIGGNLGCERSQLLNAGGFALDANGATIGGIVALRQGFRAVGTVNLTGAVIRQGLDCKGGKLFNPSGLALIADQVAVGGDCSLGEGFSSEGQLRLLGAEISGSLECQAGRFSNTNGLAFQAQGAKISGNVALNAGGGVEFQANGGVDLSGASIGGLLHCAGGRFLAGTANGNALDVGLARIERGVYLTDGFKAMGVVTLHDAFIGGNLICDAGQFHNANGIALDAERLQVKGGIFLRFGFEALGGVRFSGTGLGGNLDCEGGRFISTNGTAVAADSARVDGGVFFRHGFEALGGVQLSGAVLGGNLECEGGRFISTNGTALAADFAKIDGGVFFSGVSTNGFWADGEVQLVATTVGTWLDCTGGRFVCPDTNGHALNLASSNVKGGVQFGTNFEAIGRVNVSGCTLGSLTMRGIKSPQKMILNLRGAKVGILKDEKASWPAAGNLVLHGFLYDAIDHRSPIEAADRLYWLRLQPQEQLSPQSYKHLAAVLEGMGHDEEGKEILIFNCWDDWGHRPWMSPWKWWELFFGLTAGFGYAPWRAFLLSIVVVAFGAILFGRARTKGVLVPSDPVKAKEQGETYPKFNALIYSLDLFLPLLELGIAEHWCPNAHAGRRRFLGRIQLTGSQLRLYLWFHKIIGWFLAIFWIGGLSGLLKS